MRVLTRPEFGRTAGASVITAAVATLGTLPLIYISSQGGKKMMAAAVAALIAALAAFLCGNFRLFCMWGLTLVIPIDLSKRFGPVFLKMGGESSFRVEISDLFIAALFVFLCVDLHSGKLRKIRIPRVTYIWMTIIILGLGWSAFGTWKLTALQEVVRMSKLAVLFLVMTNELLLPNRIFHCAAGLTFGMVSEAMVGLAQYVTHKHFGLEALGETGQLAIDILATSSVQGETVLRVGGFLQHPNVFGIFLASLLPIAVGAFLLSPGKIWRLFFLASTGLGFAALIVTLSRSGWLSFAVAAALLLGLMFLHPGLRKRTAITAVVAVGAVLIVSVAFSSQIVSRLFSSRDAATLGRAEYLHDAWGMIQAKPLLGWGLNSYVFAVPPFTKYGARHATEHYKSWIPPVHNIYALWWAELGIVGLLLHLALVTAILSAGVGNLRVKDKMLFTVNAACLSGMAAFLVDGMLSFSLRFNSILRVFWVMAALIMAIRYLRLRQNAERSMLRRTGDENRTRSIRVITTGMFVPRQESFFTPAGTAYGTGLDERER